MIVQNLKYWRYRMYLLPKEHPATKKILESPTNIPCDIYIEHNGDSAKQQIDEFMKFVESHLNKIRKSHIQRSTTRVSSLELTYEIRTFPFSSADHEIFSFDHNLRTVRELTCQFFLLSA